MNRRDRLRAIADELRRAGPSGRTGQQLARRLAVSERTVGRDIAALQRSGTPVWSHAGRGGGYVLPPQSRATLDLSPTQVVLLAAAMAAAPSMPPAQFATDGVAALAKLLDVMDIAARRQALHLAEQAAAHAPGATAWTLAEALRRRRVLDIAYADANGRVTHREVEPIELSVTRGFWYLVGWCRLRDNVRWFRCDRIRTARLTGERAPYRDL